MELNLNRDTIAFLIDKAHEFHAMEGVTFPEEPLSPTEDWARQVLADHGDNPCYMEMKSTIEDLDPDQQMELVALMWIGRGDYDIAEWAEAYGHAEESWNDHTADYLIGTPLVADYLQDGLDQLDEAVA